jgi:pyridoxal phosphate enzyme (YggS family)
MPEPAADPAAIADRTARVRETVAEAAARAGRDADAVTLVAVTKTWPLATVRAAVAAGLRDLGENRVQELTEKAGALPGESAGGDVRWHLIGSLQRNKARDAAAHADLFHALDSVRLADALEKRAAQAGRVLPVLVQVNISGEDAKHGVAPDAAHDLLGAAAERPHLRPAGLMGMAAIAQSERDLERLVRPAFRRLRQLFETGPPDLSVLSMGMSGDYEVAVEEGATHVRLGTALFGDRPV